MFVKSIPGGSRLFELTSQSSAGIPFPLSSMTAIALVWLSSRAGGGGSIVACCSPGPSSITLLVVDFGELLLGEGVPWLIDKTFDKILNLNV